MVGTHTVRRVYRSEALLWRAAQSGRRSSLTTRAEWFSRAEWLSHCTHRRDGAWMGRRSRAARDDGGGGRGGSGDGLHRHRAPQESLVLHSSALGALPFCLLCE